MESGQKRGWRYPTIAIAAIVAWPLGAGAQSMPLKPLPPKTADESVQQVLKPAPGQPGTGGMPMNMMGGAPMMMNMMGMMRMMALTGPGMGGMATIDRIEGRIAFLRTELKITDAQATAWNGFAEALRANAKKLGEVRASMMAQPSAGQQQAPTMADRDGRRGVRDGRDRHGRLPLGGRGRQRR